MTFRVRFTREAEDDLLCLYEFILDRDPTDSTVAERALEAIRRAIVGLERSPFSYRKAIGGAARCCARSSFRSARPDTLRCSRSRTRSR